MVDNYDLWYFHRIDWVIHLERVLFHTFQLTAPNKLGRKKSDRLTTFKKEKNVDFYSDLDYYIKIELFFEMRNCLLKLIRFFLNYILEKYWYDSAISRIFNVKSLSKSTNISKFSACGGPKLKKKPGSGSNIQVGVARNSLPNHTDCEAAHTYYYLRPNSKMTIPIM